MASTSVRSSIELELELELEDLTPDGERQHRNFADFTYQNGPNPKDPTAECIICHKTISEWAGSWKHDICEKYFHNMCLEERLQHFQKLRQEHMRCPSCLHPLELTASRQTQKQQILEKMHEMCRAARWENRLQESATWITEWVNLTAAISEREMYEVLEAIQEVNNPLFIDTGPTDRPRCTRHQMVEMVRTEMAVYTKTMEEEVRRTFAE